MLSDTFMVGTKVENGEMKEEGIVHGHIHNYNNMTYIHGHVHHNGNNGNNLNHSSSLSPTLDSDNLATTGSSAGLLHGKLDQSHQDKIIDCQHFEFIDYHNNKLFNDLNHTLNNSFTNENISFSNNSPVEHKYSSLINDDAIFVKKRKISQEKDCSCSPRVLEVCCEVHHKGEKALESANNTEFNDFLNNDLIIYNNSADDSKQLNNHILDLNCDLTCEPICTTNTDEVSNEEDIFDKYCQVCESSQHTTQTHITSEHPGSHSNEPYHEHSYNKPQDLKILEDLCNISSLYEAPLAKHMNHHNHKHNESINLLTPLIKDTSVDHQNHHHHRIELHAHKKKDNFNRSVSYERSNNLVEQSFNSKLLHQNRDLLSPPSSSMATTVNTPSAKDPLLNTINFNWSFKKDDHSRLKCQWGDCENSYDNLIDLQKHLFKDHIPSDSINNSMGSEPFNDPSMAACNWSDCEFKSNDMCSLVNHINDQHGINFDMKVVDPNSNDLAESKVSHHNLHCSNSKCNITAPPDTVIQCKWDNCNKIFQSCCSLNEHLETTHLTKGKSKYICEWANCGKVFTQRQKLVRHLKVHSRYKPYKCDVCAKCFSSDETLKQHMRTHSGEKPYQCHICGKSFAVSTSLKIHIRTHTGEKPLECKICGKRFNESSNLSKHVKTHVKEFKCQTCNKAFNTSKKLEVHSKKCSKTH